MIEAKMSPSWAVRMLIAGLAFLGFGCWSVYDGKVKYPMVERTFQKYNSEGRFEEWVSVAGQKGWKKDPKEERGPEGERLKYIYSEWDIRTQFIMAAVCLPIGLFILGRLIYTAPRKVAADDEALYATNGIKIPFAAIREIDKKKWDRKGIAVVHYELDGKAGKTTLDDWIFKNAAAVLTKVESVVNPPPPEAAAPAEPGGESEVAESATPADEGKA